MDRVSDRIRHPKQVAMLAAYPQVHQIAKAALLPGICRDTHYHWLKTDPAYAEAFEDVKMGLLACLESEVHRRGVEGVPHQKLYRGRPIMIENPETGELEPYIERRYSDTCPLALLAKHDPEGYGRRAPKRSKPRGPRASVGGDVRSTKDTPYPLHPKRLAQLGELRALIAETCREAGLDAGHFQEKSDEDEIPNGSPEEGAPTAAS